MKTPEDYFEATPIGFICRVNKERGFDYRVMREDVISLMENYHKYATRAKKRNAKIK